MLVTFQLNGEPSTFDVAGDTLLVEALRDSGLTGTKEGCGGGVCGVCTVLVDDRPVSSCLYLVAFADGRDVWTIEGLAERFPEVVDAFCSHEAMQCGICTPGHVAAVCSLRLEAREVDDAALRERLEGNLCRCTGYQTILAAATQATER